MITPHSDKRNADTIRNECDKHEWQDHLITKIVSRNTSNLIRRMASRLRNVDKADFDYALPKDMPTQYTQKRKTRRRLQSIVSSTVIGNRINTGGLLEKKIESPEPTLCSFSSPVSSNKKKHSFMNMIDRRREKQMVGEDIETIKCATSEQALYAAIQLESMTKEKVSSSRDVGSMILYSVRWFDLSLSPPPSQSPKQRQISKIRFIARARILWTFRLPNFSDLYKDFYV